ncbi:Z1 domain-containing protein [Chlorogloea sp. CCALA 695]|uniref:Z1 domain-containing protein n=1 Tax=Chlorogloea sp. CCALA 695 TaxID=2107693 RepID=UPI001304DDC8|nr:Z1 domain-containing protein [Chlorogloea sp. CCALA 695]
MAQINTLEGDNISNLKEYLHDEENISYADFELILKTAIEVLERCLEPAKIGSVKGLIYGHIQSGKTSVILTTMALAADNGFNNFVVMTSNLNDIYEQTLERIKGALDSFQVFGKTEIKQNSRATPGLLLALVCPKHPTHLRGALNIVRISNWQAQSVIIIDDEADQASLDTNINDLNKPTSAVNRAIVDLRTYLNSHTYLQTTATPQSLLLQDSQSAFRPNFVVVTIPGTGYVGGNYFFGDSNFSNSNHIRLVPDIELGRLQTSNRIPDTVIQSMLVFFLGAAILRIQENRKNYTYLLHTSFRQEQHHLAAELVDKFKQELMNQLRQNPNDPIIGVSSALRTQLQNAYDDLQQTFVNVPPFHDVLVETARRITSTEIIEINSDSGEGIKPTPARKHTLYIGGTKIGRGVTVKDLLVTYYGRDAQQPQMDTVLQHARMYGYRQNELPATRIYLPVHLAQRFVDIHVSDNLVREQCQATNLPIQVIPLVAKGIKPTRRNVLNENTVNLVTYQGGKQYFPSLPISEPNTLSNQTQELDNLLSIAKYPSLKQPYNATIDEMLEILKFHYATPESSGAWNDDLIRQAVFTLRDNPRYQNTGILLIINRDSNLKKSASRNYTQLGSVMPGDAGNIPYGVDPNYPTLLMTRLRGNVDAQGGWDGVPFWVPVIRFPDGNYAFSLNDS